MTQPLVNIVAAFYKIKVRFCVLSKKKSPEMEARSLRLVWSSSLPLSAFFSLNVSCS
jgi:hypothetical protein